MQETRSATVGAPPVAIVGVAVEVRVGGLVAVLVTVSVLVFVGVLVEVAVLVRVAVLVDVAVAVMVGVAVEVCVGLAVFVTVGVALDVAVIVGVMVGVNAGVNVGVMVNARQLSFTALPCQEPASVPRHATGSVSPGFSVMVARDDGAALARGSIADTPSATEKMPAKAIRLTRPSHGARP